MEGTAACRSCSERCRRRGIGANGIFIKVPVIDCVPLLRDTDIAFGIGPAVTCWRLGAVTPFAIATKSRSPEMQEIQHPMDSVDLVFRRQLRKFAAFGLLPTIAGALVIAWMFVGGLVSFAPNVSVTEVQNFYLDRILFYGAAAVILQLVSAGLFVCVVGRLRNWSLERISSALVKRLKCVFDRFPCLHDKQNERRSRSTSPRPPRVESAFMRLTRTFACPKDTDRNVGATFQRDRRSGGRWLDAAQEAPDRRDTGRSLCHSARAIKSF